MNDIINYFTKSLSNSTLSLKKKGILVEKPWTLLDDDGEIQKLIFKRDKGLILSKNGAVTEGSWDYYPEARALLINRGKDKLLLQEQYVDSNVLILKKDGTANDFFALANENTIPDLNIPKYLNKLRVYKFKIRETKLFNGGVLQIIGGENVGYLDLCKEYYVNTIDSDFNITELTNGTFLTENRRHTIYVKDKKIESVKKNLIKALPDNKSIEIVDGGSELMKNKTKLVTINGRNIPDQRLVDDQNIIYDIQDSKIAGIYFVMEYNLKEGYYIQIEQKDDRKINKGDTIVFSDPISPLPDGTYKIKGKWKKIKVADGIIV